MPACPSSTELWLLDKQTSRVGISEAMVLASFEAWWSLGLYLHHSLKLSQEKMQLPLGRWEVLWSSTILLASSGMGLSFMRETTGGPGTTTPDSRTDFMWMQLTETNPYEIRTHERGEKTWALPLSHIQVLSESIKTKLPWVLQSSYVLTCASSLLSNLPHNK